MLRYTEQTRQTGQKPPTGVDSSSRRLSFLASWLQEARARATSDEEGARSLPYLPYNVRSGRRRLRRQLHETEERPKKS